MSEPIFHKHEHKISQNGDLGTLALALKFSFQNFCGICVTYGSSKHIYIKGTKIVFFFSFLARNLFFDRLCSDLNIAKIDD